MFDVNEPTGTGLPVRGIIDEVELSAKFWRGIQSQLDVWREHEIFLRKHVGSREWEVGGRATKWFFWHFAIYLYLCLKFAQPIV